MNNNYSTDNQKLVRSKQRKGGGEIRRHVYIIRLKNDEFCGIIKQKVLCNERR